MSSRNARHARNGARSIAAHYRTEESGERRRPALTPGTRRIRSAAMIREAIVLADSSAARARVAGLPLVRRTVLTLGKAGIEDVYVVGPPTLAPLLEDAS